jgi:hypothetical protein
VVHPHSGAFLIRRTKRTGQQLDLLRKQKSPSALVYQLRNPFFEIEQRAFLQAHGDAGKDFSRLEPLWTAEKARFAASSRPVPAAPLLAGLAEASENHAQRLYRAALPYGKAAGPMAGVYYLGEAEANMAFHDFVAGLELSRHKPIPPAGPAQAPVWQDHIAPAPEDSAGARFVQDFVCRAGESM